MIGNDIVDFRKAFLESNWLRRGYLDKLFCLNEQRMIFASPDPNQMVWLLWSMKEASYKIYFREKLVRIYQPKNIICRNLINGENSASGYICYNDRNYYSRSIINKDFIHTSAAIHPAVLNSLRIFIESKKVGHNGLINNYREIINEYYPSGYTVSKDRYNVPVLLNEHTGEKAPISISHHGRFISAVFFSNNKAV